MGQSYRFVLQLPADSASDLGRASWCVEEGREGAEASPFVLTAAGLGWEPCVDLRCSRTLPLTGGE